MVDEVKVMTVVTVTIKGKTYTLTQKDVEEILKRLEPEELKGNAKYYIEFDGMKFPIKKVLTEVIGLPRIAFTAMYAYNILTNSVLRRRR